MVYMNKYLQNGLIAFGAFIALACKVNWVVVFIFALLFWNSEKVNV
jgi:hypothetical protein